MFNYYLQIVKFSETREEFARFIDVYEPIIKIFEIGGEVRIAMSSIEIWGGSYKPLGADWMKKALERPEYKMK